MEMKKEEVKKLDESLDLDKMEKDEDQETENKPSAIQEILEKAVTDEEFKKTLMENPDEILDQYDLSETGRIMLKSLDEEDLEHLTAENLEEYFAADSAIYTPDFDKDMPVDYSDEDDI